MSTAKKIGVVVAVGAIISIAYYFLNKSKPKITEEQLAELDADTITPYEEQLAPVTTIEEQLKIDKCAGLSRTEYTACMGITPAVTGATRNTDTTSPTSTSTAQTQPTRTTDTAITTRTATTGGYTSPRRVNTIGRRV